MASPSPKMTLMPWNVPGTGGPSRPHLNILAAICRAAGPPFREYCSCLGTRDRGISKVLGRSLGAPRLLASNKINSVNLCTAVNSKDTR